MAKLIGNESSLSHNEPGHYSIYSTRHLPYECAPELKGVSREHNESCCNNYRIIIPFFSLRISIAVIGCYPCSICSKLSASPQLSLSLFRHISLPLSFSTPFPHWFNFTLVAGTDFPLIQQTECFHDGPNGGSAVRNIAAQSNAHAVFLFFAIVPRTFYRSLTSTTTSAWPPCFVAAIPFPPNCGYFARNQEYRKNL